MDSMSATKAATISSRPETSVEKEMEGVEEVPMGRTGSQLGQIIEKTWDDRDERRLVRKLDCLLMPLLAFGFFSLQLDRSNIANALTSTITKDIDVSRGEIASGNQLQITGIIFAEIPANILILKLGTSLWLTLQCVSWGLVGLFQAFITNKSSYYATRFLLGAFEAGYIPGSMLMMSLFYTRKEAAVRCAVFYFGNYFAAGTGSLIAAGVLRMAGTHGLAGWRWLFIIDGSFTLLTAVLFFFLLPASPLHPKSLCRIKAFEFFSEDERHIMHNRVILDDAAKSSSARHVIISDFISALRDRNLWGHMCINLLGLAPKGGLQLYSPTIIKSLGFSTTKANALASISNYGVCILSFLVSWISDRQGVRGPWCVVACVYSLVFCGVMFGIPYASYWTKYAIFTLLNSGNGISQSLNDAWFMANAPTHQKRSIGLAMAVMGSNLGGLVGQQLFQDSDAPVYTKAWLAIIGLYAGCIVLVCVQMLSYLLENRKIKQAIESQESVATAEATPGAAIVSKRLYYL